MRVVNFGHYFPPKSTLRLIRESTYTWGYTVSNQFVYLHLHVFNTSMAKSSQTKKKCRQYCSEYITFGFVESQINKQMPMCLVCEKTFSNEAMKPSRMIEHLRRVHPELADKGVTFFQSLRDQLINRTTTGSMFCKTMPFGLSVAFLIGSVTSLLSFCPGGTILKI